MYRGNGEFVALPGQEEAAHRATGPYAYQPAGTQGYGSMQ